MSSITTGVGLVSGINYTDTISKLLAISSQPRDALTATVKNLQTQQAAIAQLTASVLGVQFAAKNLEKATTFTATKGTSSDSGLGVSITGTPTIGSYVYTPVQTAQAQQLLSSGYSDSTSVVGAGQISLGYGGFLDTPVDLSTLNGGAGVQRGKIKITDRSGSSAIVDLSFAKTTDDVVKAINSTDGIGVVAQTTGDSFQLVDTTGATVANLRVQEVSGGHTAADLGLGSINTSANQATGADVLKLFANEDLSKLNDGTGIGFRGGLPDLSVTLRDGTTVNVDFQTTNHHEKTLGDIITTINAASPGKLQAQISADGDHLQLTDLSTDTGGTFAVTSPVGSTVADDLGLTGTASSGVITSRRLQGGLKSVLLSSLNGGRGLGSLGQLNLTDRAGNSANVNLASAQTLDDVISTINGAGVGISASIDQARGGITLTDTSGGTGNLVVADGDATNTATKLQIGVNGAQGSVDSGSLKLQTTNTSTLLSSLNGGAGIRQRGSIVVYNSQGQATSIDTRPTTIQTVGDVVDLINSQAVGISARINDTGDGILLTDTAGGTASPRVVDVGTGTSAADLHLTNAAVGNTLDGSSRATITLTGTETLSDVATKINALNLGVSASLFDDGNGGASQHLVLNAQNSGAAGQLLVNSSVSGLSFDEQTRGQDAVLVVGAPGSKGVLASSSTNDFKNVLNGATITVNSATHQATTINISGSGDQAVIQINLFITQYNSLRTKLDGYTSFDAATNTTGTLFGSNEALRIDSDLSDAISSPYFGTGSIQSLAELGIKVDDKGQLSLDETKFRTKLTADPTAVKDFFTKDTFGAAVKIDATLETIVGAKNSLLINSNVSLQNQIDTNNAKIDDWNTRLDNEKTTLTAQFAQLEATLAKFQALSSTISSIQFIPITSSSSSTTLG